MTIKNLSPTRFPRPIIPIYHVSLQTKNASKSVNILQTSYLFLTSAVKILVDQTLSNFNQMMNLFRLQNYIGVINLGRKIVDFKIIYTEKMETQRQVKYKYTLLLDIQNKEVERR